MYREEVTSADLHFYPLGGDPIKLSGYMVKTHGKLIPNLLDRQEVRRRVYGTPTSGLRDFRYSPANPAFSSQIKEHAEDIPEKLAMLEEICMSTWPACVEPDPEDPERTPFVAEAIISNPVTYGHSHCAEKVRTCEERKARICARSERHKERSDEAL